MPRGANWPVRGRPRVSVRYGAPITRAPARRPVSWAPQDPAPPYAALIAEDATSWWQTQRTRGAASPNLPPRAGGGSGSRPKRRSRAAKPRRDQDLAPLTVPTGLGASCLLGPFACAAHRPIRTSTGWSGTRITPDENGASAVRLQARDRARATSRCERHSIGELARSARTTSDRRSPTAAAAAAVADDRREPRSRTAGTRPRRRSHGGPRRGARRPAARHGPSGASASATPSASSSGAAPPVVNRDQTTRARVRAAARDLPPTTPELSDVASGRAGSR